MEILNDSDIESIIAEAQAAVGTQEQPVDMDAIVEEAMSNTNFSSDFTNDVAETEQEEPEENISQPLEEATIESANAPIEYSDTTSSFTEDGEEDDDLIGIENVQEDTPETQVNSEEYLVDESTARFKGAQWYDVVKSKNIIVAGMGGIGSWTTLFLSRMHPNSMFIYDDDNIEMVNLSGQCFSKKDVSKSKTSAIKEKCSLYSDYFDIFDIKSKFTEDTEASDIMICGFDNMAARKVFFRSWYNNVFNKDNISDRKNCLFIDGRLSAETIQVFCITGDDLRKIKMYQDEWLFDDKEADATICSYKQTTYCAAMIGSIINNLFVNFCTNQTCPLIDRDLPFMISYEADQMYFKTVE